MHRLLCAALMLAAPAVLPAQEAPPERVVIGTLAETPELEPLKPQKSGSGFWERVRLGVNASMMSGTDRIRSHSANTIIFRNISINSSAIRFEPRVEDNGRISVSPVIGDSMLNFRVTNDFIRDPRRDSGVLQDTALQETLWGELNAAVDLKTWRHGTLVLQGDLGYYSGDGGTIEVAVDIAEESILNPVDQDLTADDPFANYQFIYPSSGRVTQTPGSISAIWQFRPRSPFRPFIGAGFGYMDVSVDKSGSLAQLNADLSDIQFSWTVRGNLLASGILGQDAAGNPRDTITVEAFSDYLYTIRGGLEYNINRNWSVYFSSTFVQTPARIQIRALGYQEFGLGIGRNDQVNDVEGITGEDALIRTILSLPVDDAVALVKNIMEQSDDPRLNQRSYYTVFPVRLGTPVDIEIPNPTMPGEITSIQRQSKLFVHGGDVQMDSFSIGLGFRYRF